MIKKVNAHFVGLGKDDFLDEVIQEKNKEKKVLYLFNRKSTTYLKGKQKELAYSKRLKIDITFLDFSKMNWKHERKLLENLLDKCDYDLIWIDRFDDFASDFLNITKYLLELIFKVAYETDTDFMLPVNIHKKELSKRLEDFVKKNYKDVEGVFDTIEEKNNNLK